MDKKTFDKMSDKDFEYTIVLDASYNGPDAEDVAKEKAPEVDEEKKAIDVIYAQYELMCLQEPTVLDIDDAYPRTYYWRLGDKYDPAKVEVVKQALAEGKRIANTEAYEKYVESVKNSSFKPESWD